MSMPSTVALSPGWNRALPAGPDTRVRTTEAYVRLIAREAYFWGWPLANIYARRLGFTDVSEPLHVGAGSLAAPLNRNCMFTDYITPDQRLVCCPNQDVVYGACSLALDLSPVIVQVPDFGDRFWVYQMVDLRTDGFVELGKMYGTTPGFYLLVAPDWDGEVPKGITRVFRSPTRTAFAAPRVFMDDTAEDRQAVQALINQVMIYPLDRFDGTMQTTDWKSIRAVPEEEKTGDTEKRFVFPETFFDLLPAILDDAPPLPGEEARYAQLRALIVQIQQDPALKAAAIAAAAEVEETVIAPLLQFRNYGQPLPHHWSTISNEAAFGTDYFTRTAAARSNILVNAPNETKYFYQDLDASGGRLNGANRYTVTFAAGETPPANGFWSMTLYNQHHFFAPNGLKRYSLGTKNKDLKYGADGSLTLYVQADPPSDDRRGNWLPSPADADFTLYIRTYWPTAAVLDGSWTPPPVTRT
jgi:hypothetical protein